MSGSLASGDLAVSIAEAAKKSVPKKVIGEAVREGPPAK
jgi:hypothetical protein